MRQRALFSARTTNAGYLQEVGKGIDKLLSGEANEATVRAELQKTIDGLGYDPTKGGFPGEPPAPAAERGELRDLSSDRRIKLVLETNLRQVANFAFREQGMTEEGLWQYPAWELVRIYFRRHPRGASGRDSDLGWQERFARAGGQLYGGRMVALKTAPVWDALGDSGVFDDGLDTPYPPFAFNSGFGWREVSRNECEQLGMELPQENTKSTEVGLNDELKVDAGQFDADFLKVLAADLRKAAGALRMKNRTRPLTPALSPDGEREIVNRALRVIGILEHRRGTEGAEREQNRQGRAA